ncbi:MAG TPA: hypothetical protein VMW04_04770 [Patescibacteria group bacterium]|nr:hypothetical protein [Patescibacteria group bacterium]
MAELDRPSDKSNPVENLRSVGQTIGEWVEVYKKVILPSSGEELKELSLASKEEVAKVNNSLDKLRELLKEALLHETSFASSEYRSKTGYPPFAYEEGRFISRIHTHIERYYSLFKGTPGEAVPEGETRDGIVVWASTMRPYRDPKTGQERTFADDLKADIFGVYEEIESGRGGRKSAEAGWEVKDKASARLKDLLTRPIEAVELMYGETVHEVGRPVDRTRPLAGVLIVASATELSVLPRIYYAGRPATLGDKPIARYSFSEEAEKRDASTARNIGRKVLALAQEVNRRTEVKFNRG